MKMKSKPMTEKKMAGMAKKPMMMSGKGKMPMMKKAKAKQMG